MSHSLDIAIVGAASLTGEALVEQLDEQNLPVAALHLLDDADAAGQTIGYKGRNLRVRALEDFDFGSVRLVLAASPVAFAWRARAEAAGCAWIDMTGAVPGLPCVVPEVNAERLAAQPRPRRLASPSSQAVALALVLAPLCELLDVRRVSVTACVPVSCRGREGVSELARQTTDLLNLRPLEPRAFDRQIAFNLLAQVDEPDERGQGALERRLGEELGQLLQRPEAVLSVTCLQVPVFYGDSLSVSLLAAAPVNLEAVQGTLRAAPGVELYERGDYPTAAGDAAGRDEVLVGRVRQGWQDPCELALWIVSDNVRKGAVQNAVSLAELLIKDLP